MMDRVWDVIDPERAKALCATLGIAYRDPLPPYFHNIYFWDAFGETDLGADGHPKLGLQIPDLGFPRRMWAGGRITWHEPLRAGIKAERHSAITKTLRKEGRSGPFAIVTQRMDIRQKGGAVLTEERDLFYRQARGADADAPEAQSAPRAPDGGVHLGRLSFSTTQLFRYSALTFNGHRIHYDQAFTKSEFGYDAVIVQGPLLVQYLMLAAEDALGPLRQFHFQAKYPVLQTQIVDLYREGTRFWIASDDGTLHLQADARSF